MSKQRHYLKYNTYQQLKPYMDLIGYEYVDKKMLKEDIVQSVERCQLKIKEALETDNKYDFKKAKYYLEDIRSDIDIYINNDIEKYVNKHSDIIDHNETLLILSKFIKMFINSSDEYIYFFETIDPEGMVNIIDRMEKLYNKVDNDNFLDFIEKIFEYELTDLIYYYNEYKNNKDAYLTLLYNHKNTHKRDYPGDNTLEFNIKTYNCNYDLPDDYNEEHVNDLWWKYSRLKIEELETWLKNKISNFKELGVVGRSGGWLVIKFNDLPDKRRLDNFEYKLLTYERLDYMVDELISENNHLKNLIEEISSVKKKINNTVNNFEKTAGDFINENLKLIS